MNTPQTQLSYNYCSSPSSIGIVIRSVFRCCFKQFNILTGNAIFHGQIGDIVRTHQGYRVHFLWWTTAVRWLLMLLLRIVFHFRRHSGIERCHAAAVVIVARVVRRRSLWWRSLLTLGGFVIFGFL
jgi:hypothetical protein